MPTMIRERFKFEIWRNVHKLPQSLIDFWQLRELQRIANHAYENTVMYRELWENHRVKPDSIRTLADMEQFPIISKSDFLSRSSEEYMSFANEGRSHVFRKTSGTTGRPFTFAAINEKNPLYDISRLYRFLCWEGLSPEVILRSPRVVINAITDAKVVHHSFTNFPIKEFLFNREGVLREMCQIQPISLVSYPSLLVELSQAIVDFPQFKNLGIKYAVSSGESLTQSQRKFIEGTLHCKIFDRYGLDEFLTVATECRHHRGFHINVETFFLEIVDENGLRVPSGKIGRIVITDFRNTAMPFIRYDTGDRGYFLTDRCPCGLAGPRLMVEGRVGEFLTIGSRKVHHKEIEGAMESFSGAVLQYQVVKVNEGAITLSIIPGEAMNETVLANLQEKIQALIGDECRLAVEFVSEIKRTPRGKCQTLISM